MMLPFVPKASGAHSPRAEAGSLACRRKSESPTTRPFTFFGVNPVVASNPLNELFYRFIFL